MSQLVPFGIEEIKYGEQTKVTDKDINTRAQTAIRSDLAYSEF